MDGSAIPTIAIVIKHIHADVAHVVRIAEQQFGTNSIGGKGEAHLVAILVVSSHGVAVVAGVDIVVVGGGSTRYIVRAASSVNSVLNEVGHIGGSVPCKGHVLIVGGNDLQVGGSVAVGSDNVVNHRDDRGTHVGIARRDGQISVVVANGIRTIEIQGDVCALTCGHGATTRGCGEPTSVSNFNHTNMVRILL